MAFFSADEYDRDAIGHPWNVAAIVLLLLTALALFLWMAGPMGNPFTPFPSPHFSYDSVP